MSWKPAWKITGEGDKWCTNAQAFATRDEAEKSAFGRFISWSSTTEWCALESDEPVNYERVDGYDKSLHNRRRTPQMIPNLAPDQYEAIIQAVEDRARADCDIDRDGSHPNVEMQLSELFGTAFFHLLQENERLIKEACK